MKRGRLAALSKKRAENRRFSIQKLRISLTNGKNMPLTGEIHM